MNVALPSRTRRLAAGAVLVTLPVAAVAGCGAQTAAKKESVQTSLQKASSAISASQAMTVVLHLSDPKGTLRKAAASGEDGLTDGQGDLLVGTTVSITVDPVTGTVGAAQRAAATQSPAEQLRLVNLAVSVQSGGGPVAQVRVVGGDAYATTDLDRLDAFAGKAGGKGVTGQLDQLAASSPDVLQPLLADVKAGKWVKLPLSQYADRLGALGDATATPSVDPALGQSLLDAVRPYTTVTDASRDGDTRTLDVKVKAKQGLQAALTVLQRLSPALGRTGQLDTAALDRLGDGTLDGQVTLKDDHLTRITLDLQSAARLSGSGAQDLTGSTLTVDVDDTATPVAVPSNVSSVDLGALVQRGLAAAGTQ